MWAIDFTELDWNKVSLAVVLGGLVVAFVREVIVSGAALKREQSLRAADRREYMDSIGKLREVSEQALDISDRAMTISQMRKR